VVPSAAIQRASFGTFVYVIKPDGKATIRKVVLGAAEGDRVAITEGVEPGERVVLEGVDALQEGTTVEIVGAAPNRAGPAGAGPTGAAPSGAGAPKGPRP
jgi:multidrug efflux system membrane fusion protein